MTETVQYMSITGDELVERLRVHGKLFVAYALSLAQRAGLDPVEADDVFLRPLMPTEAPTTATTPEETHHWIELEAAAVEAVHGSAQVEREGSEWRVNVPVADDLDALRIWDVAPDYWAAWMDQHVSRVAARHGLTGSATLLENTLYLTFAPATGHAGPR